MPVIDSPLRYPGGKSQMIKFIRDLLNYNKLDHDITYAEPYAGGAGVALSLLYQARVSNICINDFDEKIYSIWYSILNFPEEFIAKIESANITLDSWHYHKDIYNNFENYDILTVGFSTFFLNRTNISGIITGGPIGGHDQNKTYNIDCRFNKVELIKKVKKISSFRDNITLSNLDAEDFITNRLANINNEKLFVFFDPPYYKQGKNLYANFYDHNNHISLRDCILNAELPYWILTYDNDEEIKKMYEATPSTLYRIRYSANKIRKESEFLAHSPNIFLPNSTNISYEKEENALLSI